MLLVSTGVKIIEILVALIFLALAVSYLVFTVKLKRRVAFWFEMGMWFFLATFTLVTDLVQYINREGAISTILIGVGAVLMLVTKAAIQPLIKGVRPSLADTTTIHNVKEINKEQNKESNKKTSDK
ncbi:MAG: hypothetical protein E7184_03360 [Erysipelotrichaceae bacterium]|nr:hypothetical protein [Erysipelotrichaceae bacterium]